MQNVKKQRPDEPDACDPPECRFALIVQGMVFDNS